MNIDVRNLEGAVLENMLRLLEEEGFSTTAKATRHVVSKWFDKLEEIEQLKVDIKNLEAKLRGRDAKIGRMKELKVSLENILTEMKGQKI